MTRLFDDPATFSDDALDGFADAYAGFVSRVPGGVIRADAPPAAKVAVVIGGGSGHYPAFCGVVGPGLADAAVVGNIFTSPSTEAVLSVARAADSGAGILFSFGNYAGDVMNFGVAREQLRAEEFDVRTVLVTDDIASAPPTEAAKRRGIAGDFVVFKIAGAAAEAGYDLDGVERVALRANEHTRTLGVAFDGCTMPGQDGPLFAVPAGAMGVGLGIHGEAGVGEEPMPSAAELAKRLVDGVLAERPAGVERVAAILNGLGTTKYEELFVVWRTAARLLAEAGLTVVEPEISELVTSLDMAGCSLTLTWLDDELEALWAAPANSPGYRKGASSFTRAAQRRVAAAVIVPEEPPPGSVESRACAGTVVLAFEAISATMAAHERELGELDAIAGDGDHGRGMVRGAAASLVAARRACDAGAGAGTTLSRAGTEWAARAGGTSGVLWGAALVALGRVVGDSSAPSSVDMGAALQASRTELERLGKATLGDKTMLDVLIPFADAFSSAAARGSDLVNGWREASDVARDAAESTASLTPKVGRARPLAARSVGHRDPGAVSLSLAIDAVGTTIRADKTPKQ
jgi:dihydroxyacetone kinase